QPHDRKSASAARELARSARCQAPAAVAARLSSLAPGSAGALPTRHAAAVAWDDSRPLRRSPRSAMSDHPSAGPRTEEGKERSRLNAVKHGLRSERPVLPGEDVAEWDAFHADIVSDLDPGSTLERELAERVALQLWRLRRAARYEAQ